MAHYTVVQLDFHLKQLVALALHELADRNTGGACHDFGNFFCADLGAQQLGNAIAVFMGFTVLRSLQALFQLGQLAILQLGNLVEVAFARKFFNLEANAVNLFHHIFGTQRLGFFCLPDFVEVRDFFLQLADFFFDQAKALLRGFVFFAAHGFALDLQLNQPAIKLVHHFGFGVALDADLAGRLINQVNRLVGQKPVGDVAVAQFGRRDDGRVGNLHTMVQLVLFFQSAQDGNRRFHRRFTDQDFLETALQRSVLFNVFAVLIQSGGADTMQLTARQCGLEHVAGIHRAFGLASTDHGVQFVDKNDGLAFVLRQFLEHRFQALFKFTPELGTSQQRSHVERQHALALERIGHFAGDDALRQAFDDGGLAYAGFADQNRIVLGAALQHLDGAADFIVAADHRVEFAQAGTFSQIHAVFLQGFALAFGIRAVHALTAAHRVNGRLQGLAG